MMIRKRLARCAARLVYSLSVLLVWGIHEVRAAEINVGPARALKTLQAGIVAAKPRDRVMLDAGVYLDDVSSIDKPLTIDGAGSGAILRITRPIPNRKGILVVKSLLCCQWTMSR